jgi:aldose 1-epimerase
MAFVVKVDESQLFPVINLIDTENNVEAEIYAFGSVLNKFIAKKNEVIVNVVDGFDSPKTALAEMPPKFKSAFLSPFTCRINKGKYSFNGEDYQVDKFFMPPHAIHGLLFDVIFNIQNIEETLSSASVKLVYTYNSKDLGYPFKYNVSHKWSLHSNGCLSVVSEVTNLSECSIPYAQGWHPYFAIADTIEECTLQFESNKLVEFDETLIPTKKLIEDNRFENGIILKDIFLDSCFAFDKLSKKNTCILKSKNISLTISSTDSYPYLQIYTPPHRKSIAIENLSGAPDCFNNGMGLLILEPNKTSTFETEYKLELL